MLVLTIMKPFHGSDSSACISSRVPKFVPEPKKTLKFTTWSQTRPAYYLKFGTQTHTKLKNVGPETGWKTEPIGADFTADFS